MFSASINHSWFDHIACNYTFFIFPEIGEGYGPSKLDTELVNELTKNMGGRSLDFINIVITTLRSDYHISRMTKGNGKIIRTHYDFSEGKNSERDKERLEYDFKYANMFKRKLEESFFTEDLGIHSDTVQAQEGETIPAGIKVGYWTNISNKFKNR